MKTLLKILRRAGIVLLSVIILFIAVCAAGRMLNRRTPDGGINEAFYADINGTKQWVSIYGQDRNNPVLLYMHGRPFGPTSWFDWCTFRKLSADYTVVNWDQRGCGHNYPRYKATEPVTAQDMVNDGRAMTDFLREYLQKDKITLFGHSMVYSRYAVQLSISSTISAAVTTASYFSGYFRARFAATMYILGLTQNDPELHNAAQQLDPLQGISEQYDLYMKFSTIEDVFAEVQFSPLAALLFNPYCTPAEQYRMLFVSDAEYENMMSDGHPHGDVYGKQLSIKGRTEYQVPFYLVQGKTDHNVSTMVEVAVDYYNQIDAPKKDMFLIDGGHMSPLLCCDDLAEIFHKIAEK